MSVFVSDSFTDTPGTALASHTGATGATWTLNAGTGSGASVISDANRLRATNATVAVYTASGTPATADYQVTGNIFVASKNGEFNGIAARMDSAAQTGYVVAWLNSGNQWQIYRIVAGSANLIGSYTTTLNVAQTYAVTLRVTGTFPAVRVELLIDGVSVAVVTDSSGASITAANHAGVYFSGIAGSGNAVGYQIDSLTATDAILPPSLDWAELTSAGTSVVAHFTIPNTAPLLPSSSITGFSLVSSGVAITVTAANRTASGDVTLTLNRTVYAYERPTLSYTPGNLTDTGTNAVFAFSGAQIYNGSTQQPAAGTNEVVLLGTQFGDTAGTSGHEVAKVFDADATTYYTASSGSSHYIGLDAGAAVVLRRFAVTPRGGDGTTNLEELLKGAKIQGSNTSTSAGYVDLFAFPSTEPSYFPRFDRNVTPIYTNATAYRYYRLLASGTNDSFLAELAFFTDAGPALSKPDAPNISPWGGRYPAGTATVTLTSKTTSAAIYYTTDGSTPTSGSTHYTAPFVLTIGGSGTTLKAIAIDAGLSTTSSAVSTSFFKPWAWKPAEDMYDDRGVLIDAHDGHILDDTSRTGRYYWYGAFANIANATGGPDTVGNKGVWLWSSADLYNWTFEGQILVNAGTFSTERPHVIYCAATGKYVLWAHLKVGDFSAIASAAAPAGPWHWVSTTTSPMSLGLGDFNLFVDTDGTGYVAFTEGIANNVIVARLSADYLSADGTYVIAIAGYREAPILFKRGAVYFLITSGSNYYDATLTNDEKYIVNSGASPLAAWPAFAGATALFASDPVGSNFNGQSTCVVQVPGKVDGFLYLADHFNATALYNSRYVFLPLTFASSTAVQAGVPASWDLSTFADAHKTAIMSGFNLTSP